MYSRNWILCHSWVSKIDKKRYCSLDSDKFVNHSNFPNISEAENGDMFANADIKIGEEIFCDYKEINYGDIWEGYFI